MMIWSKEMRKELETSKEEINNLKRQKTTLQPLPDSRQNIKTYIPSPQLKSNPPHDPVRSNNCYELLSDDDERQTITDVENEQPHSDEEAIANGAFSAHDISTLTGNSSFPLKHINFDGEEFLLTPVKKRSSKRIKTLNSLPLDGMMVNSTNQMQPLRSKFSSKNRNE